MSGVLVDGISFVLLESSFLDVRVEGPGESLVNSNLDPL